MTTSTWTSTTGTWKTNHDATTHAQTSTSSSSTPRWGRHLPPSAVLWWTWVFLDLFSYWHFIFRNYSMKWSEEHDLMLCREVLVMEPFKHPKQSRETGEIWGEIAQNLNGLSVPKFTVRTRSVRDRLTLLLRKYKEKVRNESRVLAWNVTRKQNWR